MAIFRRDSELDEPPGSASRERSVGSPSVTGPQTRSRPTLIAPGTEMIGEITGATDVTVEGDLQGEVRIEGTVRVGPEGRVRGALEARIVKIGGRVQGDVRGQERIVLDATAELLGDLSAPRVEIHEGAFFKGAVEMTGGGTSKVGSPAPDTTDEKKDGKAGKGWKGGAAAGSEAGTKDLFTDSEDDSASTPEEGADDGGDEKGAGADASGEDSEGDKQ